MSYKKYKWQVVAGDVNSPFFRNQIWVSAFFKYHQIFKVSRPLMATVAWDKDMKYLTDLKTWVDTYNQLKSKVEKNNDFIENIIDKTEKIGQEFNAWTYKNIWNKDLTKSTPKQLISILRSFCDKQSTLYAYGVALPILDFQDFSFVEKNLKKFLEKNTSKKDYHKYFEVFTSPLHKSFASEQEEGLLKLIDKSYSNKKLIRDLKKIDIHNLKIQYPVFYKQLQKHTQKYAWVYYAYAGPAFDESNYLEFVQNHLKDNLSPSKKLKNLKAKRDKTKQLKQKYLKELKPDIFNRKILLLAGKLVWGKPRRKDYQSKSYYHAEKFLREIGRRLHLSLNQVRSTPFDLIEKALLNKYNLDIHYLNEIYKFHICLPNDNGTITILTGQEAHDWYNKKVTKEKNTAGARKIKQLQGDSACPGKAKGTVKIVNMASNMSKMKHGDILVSQATTPQIVAAMKKASAIVTDEGGLTCHASIVSRELNIPCVIGTKIATQVLKDGDKVAVDATQGLVKKLI